MKVQNCGTDVEMKGKRNELHHRAVMQQQYRNSRTYTLVECIESYLSGLSNKLPLYMIAHDLAHNHINVMVYRNKQSRHCWTKQSMMDKDHGVNKGHVENKDHVVT